MIIATWNVNSVRVREERLVRWLNTRQPDVVCLQELKCVEEEFPREAVESAGYHCTVLGQRAYNGVAILSRTPAEDVSRGLGDPKLDEEARLLAATVDGVRVVCAYVPAGGENRQSAKYGVKIQWLRLLLDRVQKMESLTEPFALCGDFNIAPEARDVANLERWRESAVFNDELSALFGEFLSLGLIDCFRLHSAEEGRYTWWDYDNLGYQRNEGLRIDHILAPRGFEDRCYRCWVDWEEREGKKSSDHAPLLADFDWALVRGGRGGDGPSEADRFRAGIEPAEGEDAARLLIRDAFPEAAVAMPSEASVRVRWHGGFEEVLRWGYFPAGAREWTYDGAERWFPIESKRSSEMS